MGNEDCGRFYQSIGDLQKAYEAYHRMRQDAVIDKHILELNKHLASVTIEQKNWIGVVNHATKLQTISETVGSEDSKAVRPLIRIAQGLAYLAQKKYADAATEFLGVD
jgi:COP9 signalosome complex subunit 1